MIRRGLQSLGGKERSRSKSRDRTPASPAPTETPREEETPRRKKTSKKRSSSKTRVTDSKDRSGRGESRSLSPQKLRSGLLTPVITPVVKRLRKLSRPSKSQSPKTTRRMVKRSAESDSPAAATVPAAPPLPALPMTPTIGTASPSPLPPTSPQPSHNPNDIASFLAKTKGRRPGLLDDGGSKLLPPSGRDFEVDDDGYSLIDDGPDDEDEDLAPTKMQPQHHAPESPSTRPKETISSATSSPVVAAQFAEAGEASVASPVTKKPNSGKSVTSETPPPRPTTSTSTEKERRSRRSKRNSAPASTVAEEAMKAAGGEERHTNTTGSRSSAPNVQGSRPKASSSSRRIWGETLSRAMAGRETANADGADGRSNVRRSRSRSETPGNPSHDETRPTRRREKSQDPAPTSEPGQKVRRGRSVTPGSTPRTEQDASTQRRNKSQDPTPRDKPTTQRVRRGRSATPGQSTSQRESSATGRDRSSERATRPRSTERATSTTDGKPRVRRGRSKTPDSNVVEKPSSLRRDKSSERATTYTSTSPGGRHSGKRRSSSGTPHSRPHHHRHHHEETTGTSEKSSKSKSSRRSTSLEPNPSARGGDGGSSHSSGRDSRRRHSAPLPDQAKLVADEILSKEDTTKVRRGRKPVRPTKPSGESHKRPSQRSLSRSHRSDTDEHPKPESSRSHSSTDEKPSSQTSRSAQPRRRGRDEVPKPSSSRSQNSDEKPRSQTSRSGASPSSIKRIVKSRSLSRSRRKDSTEGVPSKPSSGRSQSSSEKPRSQKSVPASPRSDSRPSSNRSVAKSPRTDVDVIAGKPSSVRSQLSHEDFDNSSSSMDFRKNIDKQSLRNVEQLKDDLKQMRGQRRKPKHAEDSPGGRRSIPSSPTQSPLKSPLRVSPRKAATLSASLPPALTSPASARKDRATPRAPSPDFNGSIGVLSLEDLDVGFANKSTSRITATDNDTIVAEMKKKIKKTKKLIKRTTREVWMDRDEVVNFQRNNWGIRKALVQSDTPEDSATTLNMKIEKLLRQERELEQEIFQMQEEKEGLEIDCAQTTKAIGTFTELLEKLKRDIVPLLPDSEAGGDDPLRLSPVTVQERVGREPTSPRSMDNTIFTSDDEDEVACEQN